MQKDKGRHTEGPVVRRSILRWTGILLLLSGILLFTTWHTKVLLLGGLLLLLRREPWVWQRIQLQKRVILALMLGAYLLTFPKRTFRATDTFQSVYLNEATGEVVPMPWKPYLANVLGEEDLLAVAGLLMYSMPERILQELLEKGLGIRYSSSFQDAVAYAKRTPVWRNRLVTSVGSGRRLPSNLYFQKLQEQGQYADITHYFLHIPEGVDLANCEVVVFCHGYLGNWVMYPKLWAKYTDHIVIGVETKGWSGQFDARTLEQITAIIIPHAFQRMGIEPRKAHLVGLSNGGSAVNMALRTHPTTFQPHTLISARLRQRPQRDQIVKVIYGADDQSGGVGQGIPGRTYERHIIPGEDHSLLISKPDTVFALLD